MIKPLEWVQSPDGFTAYTSFGKYVVTNYRQRSQRTLWLFEGGGHELVYKEAVSIGEAQKAVQKDWESRLLPYLCEA